MLTELRVRDLGVIADLTLVLGPGMTAVTGETGAGKTLVVEAIELLVGGKSDPMLVRQDATEAFAEARFVVDDTEVVVARTVPATGRSRAYVDGRMAPVGALAEAGARLVDLHGQHAHQSLLQARVQREALDAFAGIDLHALAAARAEVRRIDAALAGLGGDSRARSREIDLLRFQIDELDRAAVTDAGEDDALAAEEDSLANVAAHRQAAALALAALTDEGGATDGVATGATAVAGRSPFADLGDRLQSVAAELADIVAELRVAAEQLEDDPARQDAVRTRRQLLHDLRRKYGDTLAEVIDFHGEARRRLADLESHDERVRALEAEREEAVTAVARAEAAVGRARRAAAPKLAAAVEEQLRQLAMGKARLKIEVGSDDPGDDVSFLLAANPGEPARPLSRVASGGELARAMLAARLVLTAGPPTLVFDEVDAGIGGEAALAVGRALAALAADHQVLVVTHLPQVAAFAHTQVVVSKQEVAGRTVASARVVDGDDRVAELSRMLSGTPESEAARLHAEELLAAAQGAAR